jgi:hypothetical protein
MTNTSNYGPVRRLSPPVSADRKPYSRTGLKGVLGTLDLNSGDAVVPTTLDSPYYPFHVEIPQLEAPSQRRFTVPDGPRDMTGFPTYEQYQRIEEDYLSSLSERKQPKALISQSLFNKIYAVLQNGSEDRASTAQFRFWVRKMFVLAYPQTSFNHNTGQTPEPVVLHDKRPVAIKERLYEVLCYCHALARHGGRDKTCATLRLNYSWVPKELTAKFVKSCPTCTLKRSGNPDLLSQFNYASQSYLSTAPEPAFLSGGPNDSSPGLNFVGSSSVCDNNNSASAASSGTSSSAAGFAPSVFTTTPDLSVYPSPTLSSGSGGPMTPSPYLHGGLFGYPVVFDPGHNSLSSVGGWDPSPSRCVPGYGGSGSTDEPLLRETTRPTSAADDEPIDTREQNSHQLHLPTPKAVRLARSYGYSLRIEPPPPPPPPSRSGIESTPPPCVLDGNIDPALFMEGFPPARRLRSDTDTVVAPSAPWETPTNAYGAPSFSLLLHLPGPPSPAPSSRPGTCCPASPAPQQAHLRQPLTGGMVFAPAPMGVERMKSVLLCEMQEMETEMEAEAEGGAEVEMSRRMRGRERWESPEAWLVPSDSADEADG